uniref:Uncharacterized protein n=1 Tax=Zea mays TaxID=4577 RepID=C0PAN0_MAIZE|nr:unknown [Zea mays]
METTFTSPTIVSKEQYCHVPDNLWKHPH